MEASHFCLASLPVIHPAIACCGSTSSFVRACSTMWPRGRGLHVANGVSSRNMLGTSLVGGWPTPLKNMSSSMGRMGIPCIMENKKCSKPPTRSVSIFIWGMRPCSCPLTHRSQFHGIWWNVHGHPPEGSHWFHRRALELELPELRHQMPAGSKCFGKIHFGFKALGFTSCYLYLPLYV